jgi:hypothetical protein
VAVDSDHSLGRKTILIHSSVKHNLSKVEEEDIDDTYDYFNN